MMTLQLPDFPRKFAREHLRALYLCITWFSAASYFTSCTGSSLLETHPHAKGS